MYGDGESPVVWLGMVRTWEGVVARLHYVRGSGKVPAGGLKLADGIDPAHSVWLFAGVTDSFREVRTSPGYRVSPDPIEVNAVAGEAEIAIHAGFVHGTYVKADGRTWAFSAGDSAQIDVGGVADGWIRLSLASLGKRGDPPPSAAVEAGDKILLIDSEEGRTAIVEVTP